MRKAPNQPTSVDLLVNNRLFIKQITVLDPRTVLPQHAHKYDHFTLLAAGSMQAWTLNLEPGTGEKCLGYFEAPAMIEIKAGLLHRFVTLSPNVVLYCIHNVTETGEIEVEREHQVEFED